MHELVAAHRDSHVRRTGGNRGEEHEIAGHDPARIDLAPNGKLLAHVAGHRQAVLSEHILHEPAAVESLRVCAAVPVRRPAQRERG